MSVRFTSIICNTPTYRQYRSCPTRSSYIVFLSIDWECGRVAPELQFCLSLWNRACCYFFAAGFVARSMTGFLKATVFSVVLLRLHGTVTSDRLPTTGDDERGYEGRPCGLAVLVHYFSHCLKITHMMAQKSKCQHRYKTALIFAHCLRRLVVDQRKINNQ